MAKIAYILLCHKDPDAIIEQARRLTKTGDCISIHFDGNASAEQFKTINDALRGNHNVCFAKHRVKCGWGEWSLVKATLSALTAAAETFPTATHFYMLSGDCMPIKTGDYIRNYLDEHPSDFIESFDFFASDWIKTGMKEERLIYRHWLNERRHKSLFYTSVQLQRQLGLKRSIPKDLQVQIGSQWWCLRRKTVDAILNFAARRRDVTRFFSTTWIPDETFFQTLVRHLVPQEEIECRTLTFLIFSDYGMPVNFYNDHYDLLISQDFLFARKISPEATDLKARLGDLYAQRNVEFSISNEGRNLHKFLTARGRNGRRFASRFWETASSLGHERELYIVTCKKWHVAKRLVDKIAEQAGIPAVHFLFDEEATQLPDLGGIEGSLHKRTRHRRSLLRMLFEHYESDRLLICLDPSALELMTDFYSDRAQTRMLRIECQFTDAFLLGHAHRVGLAGEHISRATAAQLLPAIRNDLSNEIDKIRDAGFARQWALREHRDASQHVSNLAEFLEISPDQAQNMLGSLDLFED